jgi:hypothetical protein
VETQVQEPLHRMVGRASGDLDGVGTWELFEVSGGTRVRYTWNVTLEKPWMRWFAPILSPVFAWNHHVVMRAGAKGMAGHLGVGLIEYRALAARGAHLGEVGGR